MPNKQITGTLTLTLGPVIVEYEVRALPHTVRTPAGREPRRDCWLQLAPRDEAALREVVADPVRRDELRLLARLLMATMSADTLLRLHEAAAAPAPQGEAAS